MFDKRERVKYAKSPLKEVICQLRFPADLRISHKEPVGFQEAIRSDFPYYEVLRTQISDSEDENFFRWNSPIYKFASNDREWALHLTSEFLALSTSTYTTWEDFRKRIAEAIKALTDSFPQPFFSRAGLRYFDFINRDKLNLSGIPWNQLLGSELTGMLNSDIVSSEDTVAGARQEISVALENSIFMTVRSGLGVIQEEESEGFLIDGFLIDVDTFKEGTISVENEIMTLLDDLHTPSSAFFRDVISDNLHRALMPISMENPHDH